MEKILVVDDDKKIVAALVARLRAENYQVEAAFDGPSAVEAFARTLPDAIIMDISMPFVNGLRTLRQLREKPGSAGVPVIFLTASKAPGLREQAEKLGAAGFIEKPYDASELLALVQRVIAAEQVGR